MLHYILSHAFQKLKESIADNTSPWMGLDAVAMTSASSAHEITQLERCANPAIATHVWTSARPHGRVFVSCVLTVGDAVFHTLSQGRSVKSKVGLMDTKTAIWIISSFYPDDNTCRTFILRLFARWEWTHKAHTGRGLGSARLWSHRMLHSACIIY